MPKNLMSKSMKDDLAEVGNALEKYNKIMHELVFPGKKMRKDSVAMKETLVECATMMKNAKSVLADCRHIASKADKDVRSVASKKK